MCKVVRHFLLVAIISSQQSCMPVHELGITQLVYRGDELKPSNVDISRIPASWIKGSDVSGVDRQVRLEYGHSVKIIVLPDEHN